jgi:glycosyltransferase involved in cell wall biosynthesis
MTKKILFITNYRSEVGGISGQVDILMNNLDKALFQCTILNTKLGIIKRVLLFFRSTKSFKNADFIHIHCCSNFGGFFPAIFGITLGKFFRKKIILTYHGGDADNFISKNKNIVLFFLKKVDKIVILSNFLEKIFLKFNLESIVIPNIKEISVGESKNKARINPHFISTRALEKLYNIDVILKAFAEVQTIYPNATLTILGSGTERENLINFCDQKGLLNVNFVGKVPNFEVNNYLIKNDILLSAPKIDNFPISLLEAFENELLVISSNVGGVPNLIDNYENGLLFENENVKDLVNMIIFALENQSESLKMIKIARIGLEKYSWKGNSELFIKLYK